MEWVALAAAVWGLYLLRRRTGEGGELRTLIATQQRELQALRTRVLQLETPPPVVSPGPGPLPPAVSPGPGPLPPAVSPGPGPLPPVVSPGPGPIAKPRIDWERWLGERGAAVAGGGFAALAGVLFFKYSIDHGLISPTLRVIIGLIVGLGSVIASETILRKRYESTANSVAGAGIVILYAATWAAKSLYDLIGFETAFALMILVTAASCLMSARHSSLVIAILGMCGGFAAPILLSTGQDRPIPLFGYVLLLDAALLYVAHKRKWPVLSALSLALTLVYQGAWIFARMGPERLFIGLAVLCLFATLYGAFSRFAPAQAETERGKRLALITQAASVLTPFAFVFYFGADAQLSPHFYPLGALMALLLGGSLWIAKKQNAYFIPLSAASAAAAVSALWMFNHALTPALSWELIGMCVLLASVAHVFTELDRDNGTPQGPAYPALVIGFALLFFTLFAHTRSDTVWPWFSGFLALAALLVRQGGFAKREYVQPIASGLAAVALASLFTEHDSRIGFALQVLALIALAATAVLRRHPSARRFADYAVIVAGSVLLIGNLTKQSLDTPAWLFFAFTLAIAAISAFSAARSESGIGYAVLTVAVALAHLGWTGAQNQRHILAPQLTAYAGLLFTALLLTYWPLIMARRFQRERFAWYGAALIGPMEFLALGQTHELLFEKKGLGLLPLTLAAIAVGAAAWSRKVFAKDDPAHKRALVWFCAVALCFISVAIPMQLHKQWVTIGWAMEGLALVLLWQRIDHVGLKYFAISLLAAASIRLVANPDLLAYYPRGGLRVLNWLLYTYWVPAACLVGSGLILRKQEMERLVPWEKRFYQKGWPWLAIGANLAGIIVFFVWINLAIADAFGTTEVLEVDLSRQPARELTRSICWALYAMTLLAMGMAKRAVGLRWISLAMLIITIGKVFLYDLGELKDLYRVVSLLGLGVSLLLVSLAYKRFVFGNEPRNDK